mmetsp:Transcript_36419/g.96853  ORF Transcript_36419/g.96853 Transcript_36419/m.96853 type:complete len:127 (+) Transcript_36419:843-1223(+)
MWARLSSAMLTCDSVTGTQSASPALTQAFATVLLMEGQEVERQIEPEEGDSRKSSCEESSCSAFLDWCQGHGRGACQSNVRNKVWTSALSHGHPAFEPAKSYECASNVGALSGALQPLTWIADTGI